MSLQVSNGWKVLSAALAKMTFDGGVIRLFSGTQPATADLAETGTLLGEVRRFDDTPLIFDADGPYLVKPITAQWLFVAVATGTLGWFRVVSSPGDHSGVSYSLPRMDGSIGILGSGAELTTPSLSVTVGSAYSIDSFFYSIPPFGA